MTILQKGQLADRAAALANCRLSRSTRCVPELFAALERSLCGGRLHEALTKARGELDLAKTKLGTMHLSMAWQKQ